MGVFATESLVEKRFPDVIYPVDIRKQAAKALKSRKDPEKKPVIIVDVLACVRRIYGDMDLICGGQGRVYLKRWNIFINAFESAGIKLVFIKDGSSSPESKRQTKTGRQYQALDRFIYPVFDSLAKGKYPELSTSSCTLPNLMIEEILTEILKREVLLSPRDKDGDQMIAEMADENTIGILTQDSDFLIYQYPLHVHYLSIKEFNFDALFNDHQTLKTVAYDRSKLAKHLNNAAKQIGGILDKDFEVGHLPIFATLSGNDIVHYRSKELDRFHAWIRNGQFHGSWIDHHETMAYVAHYILAEEIPPEPIDPWPLGRIAEIMYGDRRRREVLNESISGYFLVHPESKGLKPMKEKNWCDELKPLKPSQNPVEVNWEKLTSLQVNGGRIHALMSGDCYELKNVLQDYRNHEIPARAKLLEKFRQRLYGVLFDERPLVNGIQSPVVEWCMTGFGSLDNPVEQRIEKAPEFHPGLERLWRSEDKTVHEIRWKLFAYIVSPELDHECLQLLQDSSFIYPVCQLFIMQHEMSQPVLSKWEVEAFLLEHLRFQKLTENDFDELALRKVVPHPRGVQLASLYTHGQLEFASKIVGSIVPVSKLMPLNSSFDGIHFQELYKRCWTNRSIESEATREEMISIRPYFDLITSSGSKVRRVES